MKLKMLEHVGILVSDVDKALETWGRLLGLPQDPSQILYKVDPGLNRRAYVPITDDPDGTLIVFYEPHSGFLKDDLDEFGEGLHHLCFEVEDLEAATKEAQERGCEVPTRDYTWPCAPFAGAPRKPGLHMDWVFLGSEADFNNVRVQLQARVFDPTTVEAGA